jgi:hypothetical protein
MKSQPHRKQNRKNSNGCPADKRKQKPTAASKNSPKLAGLFLSHSGHHPIRSKIRIQETIPIFLPMNPTNPLFYRQIPEKYPILKKSPFFLSIICLPQTAVSKELLRNLPQGFRGVSFKPQGFEQENLFKRTRAEIIRKPIMIKSSQAVL